jgi:glycerol-3-phosphate dehydrogenase
MQKKYDLLIIGGGATGAGIALDAALRGLKCLLVEKNDFATGTSSRSTKLIHGGVRYLEAAIKTLNKAQYHLVKEGLYERDLFLKNASHLSQKLTLVTPLYKWYEIPYLFIGLSLYDFISGKKSLGKTQIVSKDEICKLFPHVQKHGLRGGVRYFDGSFNDARMIISLLQSAHQEGCEVQNYTQVVDFIYTDANISGAKLKNSLTNETYEIEATHIINATGVFCDSIRKLDDKEAKDFVKPSSGIHIVLDKKFLPNEQGIMIPKTEDGRVLFMLPYLDKCLVGTTDENASISEHPQVTQKEIEYLLRHLKKYFDLEIKQSDILSSWSGLRPLIVSENINNTKELVREHFITKSPSGLISIAGGKWTTYRKMAQDVLDHITKAPCQTENHKLLGSELEKCHLEKEINKFRLKETTKNHLLKTYGSLALKVADFTHRYGNEKLHPKYEILKAEVYYAIEYEFVKEPLDFLIRRSCLGLIDLQAAKESLEDICLSLKKSFSWNDTIYDEKLHKAQEILNNAI